MSKYKITYPTHTIETDDIEIVRELCGLTKAVEVSVNTPNESIDPDWNKLLDEMRKEINKQQPVSPSSNPRVTPFSQPYNPNDNWRQTFPQDYTKMQDPLTPQVTITC